MFFEELAEILKDTAVTIRIMPKNGKLTIGVVPDGIANVVPLNTTGTPQELDAEFLNLIKAPMEVVAGVAANIAEFEASVKKAEPKKVEPKKVDNKKGATKQAPAEEPTDEEVDEELTEESKKEPPKKKTTPPAKADPPPPPPPTGPVQLTIG